MVTCIFCLAPWNDMSVYRSVTLDCLWGWAVFSECGSWSSLLWRKYTDQLYPCALLCKILVTLYAELGMLVPCHCFLNGCLVHMRFLKNVLVKYWICNCKSCFKMLLLNIFFLLLCCFHFFHIKVSWNCYPTDIKSLFPASLTVPVYQSEVTEGPLDWRWKEISFVLFHYLQAHFP